MRRRSSRCRRRRRTKLKARALVAPLRVFRRRTRRVCVDGSGTIDYRGFMTTKERLRQAVETMTEDEAAAALRTLAEASGDPVAWVLDHAPLDDEPESEEEREAVEAARTDREHGIQPVPLEDVLSEFGRA